MDLRRLPNAMAFLLKFVTNGFPEEQRMRLMRLVRFFPRNLVPGMTRGSPEVGSLPGDALGKPQAWSQVFTFTDGAGGTPPTSEPVGGRQTEP